MYIVKHLAPRMAAKFYQLFSDLPSGNYCINFLADFCGFYLWEGLLKLPTF